jgi:hypothetical protein
VSIADENALPGTRAWFDVRHARGRHVEGYTTQASVLPGQRIELCVSTTPAARYEVVAYRLGWYDGDGGREVARTRTRMGLARPMPDPDPETGLAAAGWPVTDTLDVPLDAVSGHWLIHVRLITGPGAGTTTLVPIVVRPRPSTQPAILVQTPVNTLQAYNHWGGKCLYTSNSTGNVAAVKVSFDRPVPPWDESNLNSKAPLHYDVPIARWMERNGYDVGYQTNVDTHRAPWSLVGPKLVVTSAHDEYWTREMRDAFDAARDRGTNLAFLGANTAYWQIRYEDDERTIVCHKAFRDDPEPDGASKTCQFRQLEPARDEHALIGVQYGRGLTKPRSLFDFELDEASLGDPWMRGTGFHEDRSPVAEVVGYEWDGLWPGHEPPGCTRFFHHDNELGPADCIRWTAASGATVFAAGSLGLALALDDWTRGKLADVRVQRLLENAFSEMAS